MPEIITKETFDHLVDLAALQLDEREAAYLRQQLNNQLRAIQELEAIPLNPDTTTTSHGVPYTPQITPPIRADLWRPFARPEDIISQAPEIEESYIVVPEIPHTELE